MDRSGHKITGASSTQRVLIVLWIPSADRDGVDLTDQNRWKDDGLDLFGELYGGATAMPPVGSAESKRLTDAPDTGTGWVTALNAETGKLAWHFHTPSPVLSGVTPTAGGVVFAGDLAGTVYAFDAKTGDVAWKSNVGGAVGGGIVSYSVGDKQRIAVAAGMKSVVWPMAKGSAVLVVYGLD